MVKILQTIPISLQTILNCWKSEICHVRVRDTPAMEGKYIQLLNASGWRGRKVTAQVGPFQPDHFPEHRVFSCGIGFS